MYSSMHVFSNLQRLPQVSRNSLKPCKAVLLAHHTSTCGPSWTRKLRRPPSIWQSQRKLRCAEELVEKFVQSNSVVGLGTGVLVNAVIDCLAKKTSAGLLQAASEAAFQGVTVSSLAEHPTVDVAFEEVDEIVLEDPDLPFIAGRLAEPVQPNLVRMRELLAASKCNVMLVDGVDQAAVKLRGVLPVVVDADLWEDAGEALDDIFIPDAEIWRRSRAGYDPADPRAVATPYLSAQGHNLLDVKFYGPLKLFGEQASYQKIAKEIESLEGVVTHGLFLNVASTAGIFTNEGVDLIQSAAVTHRF